MNNNQAEEESLYHSLEEEAIDVDCLLVEPRSDQVSVSGVWCYEEDSPGKCIKIENGSYKSDGRCSHINMEGVDATHRNALNSLPHEVGMENFITSNVSPCDDYLLDFGFDHGACERLHVESSQFPMKGSFEIQSSLTENISGTECQNDFLSNCISRTSTNSSEPTKSFDKFNGFSKSYINQDILPPHFSQNGLDITPICRDRPTSTSSAQDHDDVGAVTHKRSRKPTKRYIDESSLLSMKISKKRREASSGCKGKPPGVRRVKSQTEVKPKDKMASSVISFDKAIQVPFISQASTECQKSNSPAKPAKQSNPFIFQAPTDCQKSNSPAKPAKLAKLSNAFISQAPTERQKSNSLAKVERRIEFYSSESEDASEAIMRSMTRGNQRKLHRLWTVTEVKKLIDGVAHFGVGKWTHIKKLLFSSSVHRTPVDLKDKWRNLLKASHALKGSRIEDDQKRSQPWRPLPKSILCRVRELASVYPYPRESKSKVTHAHHVSSPARIKGNKVPVV